MFVILIGGNAYSLFLFSVMLWAIIRNKRIKKNYFMARDAVETKASVNRLAIISPNYRPSQIQVSFIFNGEKKSKISKPGNAISGYHKIFAKYNNKKINILYSPKYDQVLILHNK
jgi:hypothetical protein